MQEARIVSEHCKTEITAGKEAEAGSPVITVKIEGILVSGLGHLGDTIGQVRLHDLVTVRDVGMLLYPVA